MASDSMQMKQMSPRQSPKEIGSAAMQWACTRRGRMLVLTIMLFAIFLALLGMQNHEVCYTHTRSQETELKHMQRFTF
jgi:hypothetical protein